MSTPELNYEELYHDTLKVSNSFQEENKKLRKHLDDCLALIGKLTDDKKKLKEHFENFMKDNIKLVKENEKLMKENEELTNFIKGWNIVLTNILKTIDT